MEKLVYLEAIDSLAAWSETTNPEILTTTCGIAHHEPLNSSSNPLASRGERSAVMRKARTTSPKPARSHVASRIQGSGLLECIIRLLLNAYRQCR